MFVGQLVDNRIIVWDLENSRSIFGSGYYGKPLGVPKPKGTDFDARCICNVVFGILFAAKAENDHA